MKRMLITLLCLFLCCAPALASETEIRYPSEAATAYAIPEREHKVRFRLWEEQALRDVFFHGDAVNLVPTYEEVVGAVAEPGEYRYMGNKYGFWLFAYGGSLDYERTGFSSSSFEYLRMLIRKTTADAPKEIAGVTEAQAIERTREMARAVGLTTGDTIQATPITHAYFLNAYRAYYQRQVEEAKLYNVPADAMWLPDAPEDMEILPDGYLIRLALCLDGIPIMREAYDYKASGHNVYPSTAHAYVTDKGIEYFITDGSLYEIVESRALDAAVMPLDKAKGLLEKKYKNLIMSKPVEVERIGLEYVPIPTKKEGSEFILRPAWCFYLVGPGALFDDSGENTPVYFDAVTGKELS